MSNRRIVVTVLVMIVVFAILSAGGYALFRLGYARGLSETAGGIMMRGFDGRFDDFRGMPFHDFDGIGGLRERMPMAGFAFPGYRGYLPFGGFSGLLLLIGVAALVVIAINGLVGKGKQNSSTESSQAAEDPKSARRSSKESPDR